MNKDVLRLLRIVKEYTQQAIADVLGISQNSYSRLENNPKDISDGQAKKLAKFYKVDPADLFTKTPVIMLGKAQDSEQQSAYIALLKGQRDFLKTQHEELLKISAERKNNKMRKKK